MRVMMVLMAICGISVSVCEASILANGGFEDGSILGGQPMGAGYWAANDQVAIVGAVDGIVPFEGDSMLQFQTTGSNAGNITSDIQQLVDLAPYEAIVRAGIARGDVQGWFNHLQVDEQTDRAFVIEIAYYAGDMTDYPTMDVETDSLYYRQIYYQTDFNPETWELIGKSTPIPIAADYAAIHVYAAEDVYNDTVLGQEFDGHFADAFEYRVVPEPMSLVLLGLGGLLIRKKKV